MKFGKFMEIHKIKEWELYYIDYKSLKKEIKNCNTENFYKLINQELNKLNSFIKKSDLKVNDKLKDFLVLNYMALFKSVKKHDKKLSKQTKIDFFNFIQNTYFYKFYLNIPRTQKEIKLVIFDKDGTLIKLDNIFGNWIIKLAYNLEDLIGDKNRFFNYMGFKKNEFRFNSNSAIAKGTIDDVRNCIIEYILKNNNIDKSYAIDKLKSKWIDVDINEKDLIQCGNIINIFEYLKNKNIKIAICTSDDRKVTEKTIKLLNINNYVNAIKCGDDPISSKPSPEPIWEICSDLEINPENTIMIGDTISDIHAGINAKCGKVIGVLTGGYNDYDLNKSDLILNSIDDLVNII